MTVTSKGQVTIPVAVRKHLRIERNQKIALVLEDDGSVRLKVPRYQSVADVRGAAGSLKQHLSWGQLRAIAHEDRGLGQVRQTQSRKTSRRARQS